MSSIHDTRGSVRKAKCLLLGALTAGMMFALAAPALAVTSSDTTQFSITAGTLDFAVSGAPDVPNLPAVTLDGTAQTKNATMSNWTVNDATGSGSGWKLQVNGDAGAGSAVFKEYCTGAVDGTCLTNGVGYVAAGKTLAANSLTLASTSAAFTAQSGTTGAAPTHTCSSACNVDSAAAVKVASAAVDSGMGRWRADSYTATSLALSVPTTVKAFDDTEKVYRVNLLWTLATGP